jgi:hypothetical protein
MDEPISTSIPNFTWAEVCDKDSHGVRLTDRFWKHMALLQELRDWWDAPLTVTSGYRTVRYGMALYQRQDQDLKAPPAYSRAQRSQHRLMLDGAGAFATDIVPSLASPKINTVGSTHPAHAAIDMCRSKARELGFTGIGRYAWGLHLDLRGTPAEWEG